MKAQSADGAEHINKVRKIDDVRLLAYTKRTRSGSTQIFFTGSESRDWDRYQAEGGNRNHGVEMHDKPDTIRMQPPEKHYYAELIDGEWWWVNGCAECNGKARDWMTYIECAEHNVCRTCRTPRAKLKETPWGGKHGWQCVPCADAEKESLKIERLETVAAKHYDERDFYHRDKVTCPHCSTAYQPECEISDGEETCDLCGGKYFLEVEHSVSYTTKVVGDRITA